MKSGLWILLARAMGARYRGAMHHPPPEIFREFHRLCTLSCVALLGAALTLSGCAAVSAPEAFEDSTPAIEDEAFAIADATYRAYIDALNQVDLSDPATFEEVYRWTTGETRATVQKSLTTMHADGWNVTGSSKVTLTSHRTQDADADTTVIDVCLDVSSVDLTDTVGASMVAANRGDFQRMRISVAIGDAMGRTGQVTFIAARDDGPVCEGSSQ